MPPSAMCHILSKLAPFWVQNQPFGANSHAYVCQQFFIWESSVAKSEQSRVRAFVVARRSGLQWNGMGGTSIPALLDQFRSNRDCDIVPSLLHSDKGDLCQSDKVLKSTKKWRLNGDSLSRLTPISHLLWYWSEHRIS
jgi:hypothetical protein